MEQKKKKIIIINQVYYEFHIYQPHIPNTKSKKTIVTIVKSHIDLVTK